MGRIVVVGGLNMDLHLFGLHQWSGQAPLIAEHHLVQPGGKGGNVARAVARLGADVQLVARVGDDDFGRACVDAVAADGVDTSGVDVTAGVASGFVAIELTEGRHRSLVFAPGANEHLSWGDVEPFVRPLGAEDVVVAQAEIPPDVLTELCALCRERDVALFLDPAPPDRIGRDHLLASTVITPNLPEAAQLVGRSEHSRLWPALAARELVESGARRVIVKAGASGALLVHTADGQPSATMIPTADVEMLDETGAGDVFLAALAVRRLEGADWHRATRFANAASALSVASHGLMLPDRAMVDAAVERLDEMHPSDTPWSMSPQDPT